MTHIKPGNRYQLRTDPDDPELGDYSGSIVLVEAGPRGEGSTEQYLVRWDIGPYDVDWINVDLFEGCKIVPHKEPFNADELERLRKIK